MYMYVVLHHFYIVFLHQTTRCLKVNMGIVKSEHSIPNSTNKIDKSEIILTSTNICTHKMYLTVPVFIV